MMTRHQQVIGLRHNEKQVTHRTCNSYLRLLGAGVQAGDGCFVPSVL